MVTEREKLLNYIDKHKEETTQEIIDRASAYGITVSEELIQDLKSVMGMDSEKELCRILIKEIAEAQKVYTKNWINSNGWK